MIAIRSTVESETYVMCLDFEPTVTGPFVIYGIFANPSITLDGWNIVDIYYASVNDLTINSGTGTVHYFAVYEVQGDLTGTIGTQVGLYMEDMTLATNNFAILTGAGLVSFGDAVGINTQTPGAQLHVVTADANTIGLMIMGSAGQAEPYFTILDSGENVIMNIGPDSVFYPLAATTAGAPSYTNGGIWFDTTKDKLQVGGAAAWESIHSGVGSAYTQTYSTSATTMPNQTAATLTDNTGGSADTTLASVGTTYSQTTMRNNFADLAAMVNKNTADHLALMKLENAIIDDLQAMKIVT